MLNLTFGEQVKIVLSRKGMTIKELAEQIEEKTGKKMSRQNLTQRLGRDNFQEQDMRMIAEILGCSFQLSILATVEAAQKASEIEEESPTESEIQKLEKKKERKMARAAAKSEQQEHPLERDLTMGEFVEIMESAGEMAATEEKPEVPEAIETPETIEAPETLEASQPAQTESTQGEAVVEVAEQSEETEASKEPEEAQDAESGSKQAEPEKIVAEEPLTEPAKEVEEKKAEKRNPFRAVEKIIRKEPKKEERRGFEPIKKRADEEEDLVNGDVNPYTGHEYQSNSVRMHPKRIGYVQVYDRKDHKWTDMTEWAFLGMEERKKQSLGRNYLPPIYLD